jgi:hypothetical protein
VRTKENPLLVIPCSAGDKSDYEQVQEEESDANGRNGRDDTESLRGKIKTAF